MLENVLISELFSIHSQSIWLGKSPMKLASTFLYEWLIRYISDMRLDIKVGTYQEGNVCRKLLTFQQVLWILDRPIGHVGGNVLAGGRGKPAAQWHLCHLSALLKADQCVSGGKSNNRRLVTTSQPASGGVECNQWHYLLMPGS